MKPLNSFKHGRSWQRPCMKILSSHLIYPLPAWVVGAPQMISQPVSSIFFLFSTALWDFASSRPVHSHPPHTHTRVCGNSVDYLCQLQPNFYCTYRPRVKNVHTFFTLTQTYLHSSTEKKRGKKTKKKNKVKQTK